jgi:surfactin synthase thioesterase subunit
MAALYISEMRSLMPQGPYLVGGMCFGATVALEMARQLEDQGQKVALLMLFDPSYPSKGPDWVPPKKNTGYYFNSIVDHITGGTFFKRIVRLIRRTYYGYLRKRRNPWYVRNVEMRHREAFKKYQTPIYRGRVAFFQSDAIRKKSVSLIWKEKLTGPVEFFVVPGSNHRTFLKQEENTRTLANWLTASLDQVQPAEQQK